MSLGSGASGGPGWDVQVGHGPGRGLFNVVVATWMDVFHVDSLILF